MNVTVTTELSGNKIEITKEVKNEAEAFSVLSFWTDLPKACGLCQKTDSLRFEHRTPKGYHFYSIFCTACQGELRFGQKKEDHSLFPKGWSKLGEVKDAVPAGPLAKANPTFTEDDIPF